MSGSLTQSITGSTGTTTDSTYSPRTGAKRVACGIINEIELLTGVKPLYNTATTLNSLYNILPTTVPGAGQHPTLKYFGIGIKGTANISEDATEPRVVMGDNLNLYGQIPFRVVPIEQDLDDAERAQYRMRVPMTLAGDSQIYVCYYLKVLNYTTEQVTMTRVNPQSQILENYTLDTSKLKPTPPTTTINGKTSSIGTEVNIGVSATLPISGSEVLEAIQILFGGDLNKARITEIGVYTGTDYVTTAKNALNADFQYTESIMTQLAVHRTFNGTTLDTPSAGYAPTMSFGSGNMVFLDT